MKGERREDERRMCKLFPTLHVCAQPSQQFWASATTAVLTKVLPAVSYKYYGKHEEFQKHADRVPHDRIRPRDGWRCNEDGFT